MTEPARDDEVPAGAFSAWLVDARAALRGDRPAVVTCGTCTACCESAMVLEVGPDEVEALARIPASARVEAAGLPEGHVLVGFDEHGRCHLLVDGACSIYEHRPRTCRSYDCRVFAAAGVPDDHDGQAAIDRRARRWRFDFPSPGDRADQAAVRGAASFVADHPEVVPDELPPGVSITAHRRALLALQVHDLFLAPPDGTPRQDPDPAVVRAAIVAGSVGQGGA